MDLKSLQKISYLIEEDIYPLLDYKKNIASYDLPGSSTPRCVKAAINSALKRISKEEKNLR